MTEAEVTQALENLPRFLRNEAASLQRWATMLETPWRGVGLAHSHQIGVIMGALRYKAQDLDKIAHAIECKIIVDKGHGA